MRRVEERCCSVFLVARSMKVALVAFYIFLLVPVCSFQSFVPTRNHRHHHKNMGIVASFVSKIFSGQETKTKDTDEWKRVVDEFTNQVLDPSYINLPVRATTVEAAEMYPADSTESQPGLMPGSHKHLGGAYDLTDGCIYGVPANSRSILCIHPEGGTYKMTTIPLPERVKGMQMKWLRGIFAHGYLWAIPAWADSVLCVDVDAFWKRRPADGDIVKLLPLPKEHKQSRWQWHGAGINNEKTAIYCIPSNAQQVLKVDLESKTTSLIPIDVDKSKYPDFRTESTNKWYGGILGEDNAVYGIPYRSCAVLRIDCATDSAALIGPDYGIGKFNWHGGIQISGKIYAHPSHAPDTVLVIDTRPGVTDEDRCSELTIRRAEYDTDTRKNYKWLGGAVGADSNIYCPACDTSTVLKIDTKSDECSTFGFVGSSKNKSQGGILGRDDCVYCIPASGRCVVRIATSPDIEGENPIQLLGDLPVHADKWQGAACGIDGCLYFIPENGYRVLKVTPPSKPPVLVDGNLPEGDVKLEFL